MKPLFSLLLFSLLLTPCLAQPRYTLDQCLDSARAHNRTLQNAALAIEQADLQVSEARTKYYPQISANLMAFHTFDKMVKGDGVIPPEVAAISPALADYVGQPYAVRELNSAYTATLSVIQPIYTGGQLRTANRLAALQRDVEELKLHLQEHNLEQKIIENYWQIAAVKYNLSTLDAADNQVAEVRRQVEQFLSAGMCTDNDLLRVKLRQQELASQRLRLDNAQHVLLLLLAQQIGLADQEMDIELGVRSEELGVRSEELGVRSEELGVRSESDNPQSSNREELSLAAKSVEAAQLQLKMERAKLMPTVGIGLIGYNAGIGGLSSRARSVVDNNMFNAMVAATVSVPISDWWGGSKAIKRRQLEVRRQQNNLLDLQEQINVDIESARADLTQATKQIEIAQASVDQATENLRITTLQYRAGTAPLTDLLDAETLHRQAQNSLNNARADYQRSRAVYLLKSR
ncbi:MAG: TolC family protein [Bacteroidaceae bacterium]|nr:TolC family protein [Bacteroidaceae bacterium]